jgi:AraC family cel operon transcriptional repressor
MLSVDMTAIPQYLEKDYFDEGVEMHYALLQNAEKIGPTLHTHEFFEIFLLIEGQIKHLVNGRSVTLFDGSMTLIRPNDAHYYRPIPGCACQIINLAISHRAIDDLFAYLGEGFHAQRILDFDMPPAVTLAPTVKHQVIKKMEQLHNIPIHHPDQKQTALRMLLFELVTQYFPLSTLEIEDDIPQWLRKTCEEMQKPENLAAGVPRMLALSAVSAEHLARTSQKFLNQTPTNYVNHLRLTYAANLLTHGDRHIMDIAAEVGFESLSYFYSLFKKNYGLTPRQFRNNHQSEMLHGSAN